MPTEHLAWSSITTGIAALSLLFNAGDSAYKLSHGMTANGSIPVPLLGIYRLLMQIERLVAINHWQTVTKEVVEKAHERLVLG